MKDQFDDVFSNDEYEKDEWDTLFEEIESKEVEEEDTAEIEKQKRIQYLKELSTIILDKMKSIFNEGIDYDTYTKLNTYLKSLNKEDVTYIFSVIPFLKEIIKICDTYPLDKKIYGLLLSYFPFGISTENTYVLEKKKNAPDRKDRPFVWWRHLILMLVVFVCTMESIASSIVSCIVVSLHYFLYRFVHTKLRKPFAFFVSSIPSMFISLLFYSLTKYIAPFILYLDITLWSGLFCFTQITNGVKQPSDEKKESLIMNHIQIATFFRIAIVFMSIILILSPILVVFWMSSIIGSIFIMSILVLFVLVLVGYGKSIGYIKCYNYLKKYNCLSIINSIPNFPNEPHECTWFFFGKDGFYINQKGVVILPFDHIDTVRINKQKPKELFNVIEIITIHEKKFTFNISVLQDAGYAFQIMGQKNKNITWINLNKPEV